MCFKAVYGVPEDIDGWIRLVGKVSWNFPGLETADNILEHRQTVLKFIEKRQAVCAKDNGEIIGVLLFSRKRNMICCLAVSPAYRRKGVAAALMTEALGQLDRSKDITVSTFRADDPKGEAPRALYKKFGFVEGELIEEFGYPNQRFIVPSK